MSVIFMDGFDANDFTTKWAVYNTTGITYSTATRFGTGGCITAASGDRGIQRAISAAGTIYLGFAAYIPSQTYATNHCLLRLYSDSGNTPHLFFSLNTTATLNIYRGDYNSTLLVSYAIPLDTWSYIEVSATIADSGGTLTVRVNGVDKITFTGDTRNGGTATTIDKVVLGVPGGNAKLDDFYISDSAFMGDIRIQTLVPSAAGSSTQLTATGGANYANTADIPDNTATYNASSTVGNKDLYALGDLAASTSTVKCVQVNTHAWKDDAGAASLKAKVKSGATEVAGSTVALPSSVAWHGDVWETDPNTSTAWTVSGVNALEAGAEVA